jgi:hypothetical protein
MVNQYEQMMVMMHSEMNKLIAENKQLKDQANSNLDSRERE